MVMATTTVDGVINSNYFYNNEDCFRDALTQPNCSRNANFYRDDRNNSKKSHSENRQTTLEEY